ncbi:hypothetical protein VTK73DRAFT_7483 [Phialemonium thermophilum]|uniref:Uncharacterized protein n=1 Tax=Phialemonium thermophilum TaxID=223376 RepID=A0ABR3XS62_9PEZI
MRPKGSSPLTIIWTYSIRVRPWNLDLLPFDLLACLRQDEYSYRRRNIATAIDAGPSAESDRCICRAVC